MKLEINPHGITIIYHDEGVYLHYVVSSSDDYEIELFFKDEDAIQKEFGKSINEIDGIDMIAHS